MSDPISSVIGMLPPMPTNGKPRDLASTAQQFEALMMHQMLQSARGASGTWFGTDDGGEDQASAQAMDIAQEQFAGALAAQGGIGLAKLIVSRLVPGTESGA